MCDYVFCDFWGLTLDQTIESTVPCPLSSAAASSILRTELGITWPCGKGRSLRNLCHIQINKSRGDWHLTFGKIERPIFELSQYWHFFKWCISLSFFRTGELFTRCGIFSEMVRESSSVIFTFRLWLDRKDVTKHFYLRMRYLCNIDNIRVVSRSVIIINHFLLLLKSGLETLVKNI